MSENQPSRKKFLQYLGLTAGASLLSKNSVAGFVDHTEILKLTPVQQEFMLHYEKWMDAFIDVIRVQKIDLDNVENNTKMIALTEWAEEMKPEISEFMKDKTFSLIYMVCIDRMSKEIK